MKKNFKNLTECVKIINVRDKSKMLTESEKIALMRGHNRLVDLKELYSEMQRKYKEFAKMDLCGAEEILKAKVIKKAMVILKEIRSVEQELKRLCE